MGWQYLSVADVDVTGYVEEGVFISIDTQVGVEDTPKTVEFGAGGLSNNGHINVDSNGELEVLTAGFYSIKQRVRVSRAGASGSSELFLWAEVSIDGGSTWLLTGNSVDVSLDTSSETMVLLDIANIALSVGVKLRSRFARSSTGTDFGDLSAGVPSAALASLGVPVAPSAQVTIFKI